MPKNLIDGFKRFISDNYDSDNPVMPDLVKRGQDPDYFIISCIDSRSNAGTMFQTPPGTFFSHKAMGAIVRPYKQGTALAAALQFALNYNNVRTVVLLGHTGCGAVKALIDDIDDPEISSFIAVAKTGLECAHKDHACDHPLQRKTEEHILRQSRENLKQYPSVAQALGEGRLEIRTWLFDMANAALHECDPDTDQFHPIVQRKT